MIFYVFGNSDLVFDSVPLKILPGLRNMFPEMKFVVKDPNEEWEEIENVTIIDSAQGIDKVTVFDDLSAFSPPPNISMHDFDAYSNLRFLQKLGKLKKIKIICLPQMMCENEAISQVSVIIRSILL